MMLELSNITAGYYKKQVLNNVSFTIKEGDSVLLIGPNGAGKSTLLKVIAGFLRPWHGEVIFNGKRLNGTPPAIRARLGIGYLFQGGEIFTDLTVRENLELSLLTSEIKDLTPVFDIFPHLKERLNFRAGLLSGGERHQLALAMIFLRRPRLLLLDEPSAGLSPALVGEITSTIQRLRTELNATMLLVEQNISYGLQLAQRVLMLRDGTLVNDIPADAITNEILESLFFGK